MPVIQKPFIHPSTPKRLRAAFHKAKNRRGEGYKLDVLAKNLKVNIYYLYKLIKKGEEPNDSTEKLRDVRARMFLPRRKHKPAQPKNKMPLPEQIQWWRKLPKSSRDEIILQLYQSRKVSP
jgi:hypothetical protein